MQNYMGLKEKSAFQKKVEIVAKNSSSMLKRLIKIVLKLTRL